MISLSDLGYEFWWNENNGLMELFYREEYWGHCDMRQGAGAAINEAGKLADIWYGRKKVCL